MKNVKSTKLYPFGIAAIRVFACALSCEYENVADVEYWNNGEIWTL